jgi:signal transduction histidine kinase/CheY-like chemotaxis protein
VSLPVYLASRWPGLQITRHSLAVGQILISALFIHLSGGRIETHFHLFGSLAFLSFYRDWRVLVTASIVTAIDHFVRGAIWPESIYGVLYAPVWRAFEHIGWVVFEDVFLLISIRQSIREMHKIAWRQAALESTNARVERTVAERTADLIQEISDRRRAESALVQSQKMETVGKLAGGVAHEFNTIMATIIGQCEMLLTDLPPALPLRKSAIAIRKAAERAAILTRQLLAYGRKQILRPQILDLNAVLTGMQGVVCNLLGREIDVRIIPGAGLHRVRADAGQIEQVIINLAVNAAVAMPDGGRLTIETANATLDSADVSAIPELKAGNYIRLTVSDNGTGMSETVKAHAFEPFFTTKDIGQGTGLGLSTCYGIVKQSGGHISVQSEPGCGAVFTIFLPRVAAAPVAPLPQPARKSPRGNETILLMETDDALRTSAAIVLKKAGYTVYAVGTSGEGLGIGACSGAIDLLFTNIVRSEIDGQDLLERLQSSRPDTKALFTSAHTKEALVRDGFLRAEAEFLPKPYTPALLLKKTRQALDSENHSPAVRDLSNHSCQAL